MADDHAPTNNAMPTPVVRLNTGDHLIVRGSTLREVIVVQVKYGLIWTSGSSKPGEPDELVEMECTIAEDAQYRALARVVFVQPESYALRRVANWERVQRRADVRVRATGIPLELAVPPELSDKASLKMVDLSAGGLSAAGGAPLEVGDSVQCCFELPGVGPLNLVGRVVRLAEGTRRPEVAVKFEGLDHDRRSQLMRWVFQEQLRRHKVDE